jgi:DNA-binding NarL/FixJ family response regulator
MPRATVVLVAHDNAALASGTASLLRDSYRVPRAVADLEQLEPALSQHQPRLSLLPLMWGSTCMLGQLPSLLKRFPDTRFIMFSRHSAASFVVDARRAGAVGYLRRPAAPGTILAAVRDGLAGLQVGPSARRDDAASANAEWVRNSAEVMVTAHHPGTSDYWVAVAWLGYERRMSPRQSEVALAIRDGCSEKQIAVRVGCSMDTVHSHVRAAYSRLRPMGALNQATVAVVVEKSLRLRPPKWRPPGG